MGIPRVSATRSVLIVGASVRAAAWSAVRAGWDPVAIDLFGDRDLRAVATVRRVEPEDYPTGLRVPAREFPGLPMLYTGALENHPRLVDRLARGRRLLGNPADVLRRLRNPIELAQFWQSAGVSAPEATAGPDGVPRDGSWLAKPIRSAGGRGIRPFLGDGPIAGHYFQRRIAGRSGSAVFVGDGLGRARPLGSTHQLLDGFRYAGSVGPWRLDEPLVARLGDLLASRYQPRGPFGVDFVERDGVPWPVEVNPRYTASVEVLELALGRSVFSDDLGRAAVSGRFVGKRIVLADRACRFPDWISWSPPGPWDLPEAADLPGPGEQFEPGQPVLTVMAEGDSIEAVGRTLQIRHDEWLARLAGTDFGNPSGRVRVE